MTLIIYVFLDEPFIYYTKQILTDILTMLDCSYW